ncbi:SDR family NAD(P)-dependent oxidoreductase [Pedobacter antarcticus]|uniref:SDR family NAD(P)-dependent oxidoreductase n=1 Tax=Pedobacter antarcticus TaxID=34086 RepID=UPI00293022C4|nr:SDR family NAD(P)-dependent oxidoreductase [Pedobacter antarcticus]
MNFKESTVLITGAGTGMGLAAAKWFSEQGSRVVMVARNEQRLKNEAAQLKNASYIICDLSLPEQLHFLVENIKLNYQDINVVFLNAGVATNYTLLDNNQAYETSIKEMSTNFHPVVYLTHQLAPLLELKKDAAFIITTSGVAFAPDLSHPTYSATKAALHNYILGLRLVLQRKESPIKIYELMAPLVDTPFSQAVQSDLKVSPDSVIERLITGIESQEYEIRPGLSEDIYQTYLRSPLEALLMVNQATGA